MKRYLLNAMLAGLIMTSSETYAGITVTPYASISSTKTIKPSEAGKETSTTDQKTTYGLKVGIKFFTLFSLQLSGGQSRSEKLVKTTKLVDTYNQVDYATDFDMSTNNPNKEVKVTEVQRLARAGLTLDPGFWIFILRAQGGVQATQRIITVEEEDSAPVTKETPITYKPYAGAGFGVKLAPRMSAIAEYTVNFYSFPDLEPFEREMAINFIVAI